jgi:hypothetical protein
MTRSTERVDRKELQSFYNGDVQAKALFDHFASRERNRKSTTVDRLISKLAEEGGEMARGDVIRVLQRLEELGCGRFVAGRKGHPSRFEWAVGLVDVGRVAAGEPVVQIEAAPANEVEEPSDDLLEHNFRLRRDMSVPLRLPADLTSAEASRLAAFIQTLPFDGERRDGFLSGANSAAGPSRVS